MRTTVNIQDDLLKKAIGLSSISEKTKLVNLALRALIEKFTAERLASLEGSEPKLKAPRRRRAT